MQGFSTEPVVERDLDVDFAPAEILETPPFPRWKHSAQSGEELRDHVDRLHGEVEALLAPMAVYRFVPFEESGIAVYDPPPDLQGSDYLVIGLVSIGRAIEEADLGETLLEKLIVDALENVAIQFARTVLLTGLRDDVVERGYKTTQVIAPGTGHAEWPVENRQFIYDHLPLDAIDVEVTESGFTTPRKTFSFVLGVGKSIEQADLLLTCRDCDLIGECEYAGTVIS